MRISVKCMRCGFWFDNLRELVRHSTSHESGSGSGPGVLPQRSDTNQPE